MMNEIRVSTQRKIFHAEGSSFGPKAHAARLGISLTIWAFFPTIRMQPWIIRMSARIIQMKRRTIRMKAWIIRMNEIDE